MIEDDEGHVCTHVNHSLNIVISSQPSDPCE